MNREMSVFEFVKVLAISLLVTALTVLLPATAFATTPAQPTTSTETTQSPAVDQRFYDRAGNFDFQAFAESVGAELTYQSYCYTCGQQSVQGTRDVLVRTMTFGMPDGQQVVMSATYDEKVGVEVSISAYGGYNQFYTLAEYGNMDQVLAQVVFDTDTVFFSDSDCVKLLVATTARG